MCPGRGGCRQDHRRGTLHGGGGELTVDQVGTYVQVSRDQFPQEWTGNNLYKRAVKLWNFYVFV